jgi:uncharacterized RDD family membrane protein YckC
MADKKVRDLVAVCDGAGVRDDRLPGRGRGHPRGRDTRRVIWPRVLETNINGGYWVFEAARRAGTLG